MPSYDHDDIVVSGNVEDVASHSKPETPASDVDEQLTPEIIAEAEALVSLVLVGALTQAKLVERQGVVAAPPKPALRWWQCFVSRRAEVVAVSTEVPVENVDGPVTPEIRAEAVALVSLVLAGALAQENLVQRENVEVSAPESQPETDVVAAPPKPALRWWQCFASRRAEFEIVEAPAKEEKKQITKRAQTCPNLHPTPVSASAPEDPKANDDEPADVIELEVDAGEKQEVEVEPPADIVEDEFEEKQQVKVPRLFDPNELQSKLAKQLLKEETGESAVAHIAPKDGAVIKIRTELRTKLEKQVLKEEICDSHDHFAPKERSEANVLLIHSDLQEKLDKQAGKLEKEHTAGAEEAVEQNVDLNDDPTLEGENALEGSVAEKETGKSFLSQPDHEQNACAVVVQVPAGHV